MKRISILLFSTLFTLFIVSSVYAKEPDHYFAQTEEHACYIEHGKRVTNQWVQDDKGNWYYASSYGELLKNTWFQDSDGKWYYFGKWAMLHDTTTPDGYTVGADGAWIKDGQVVVETTAETAAQ